MQLIRDLNEWRALRASFSSTQHIGFVPTMGGIHAGHLSLYAKSLAENNLTIASLFVNPTQFNQAEDFKAYPRPLETDLAQLSAQGIQYCLLPTETQLYADHGHYKIEETHAALEREGHYRPGHFSGVLTIVMKLFQLIRPHRAYFGEKDYQQYELIRGMVDAFFMNIAVIACPTVRDASGLPYSSRNQRLSPAGRRLAAIFADLFAQSLPLSTLKSALEHAGITVEYLTVHQGRRYIAVTIETVRLIDNRPHLLTTAPQAAPCPS